MNSEKIHHKLDAFAGRTRPLGRLPYAKAWGYDRVRLLIDRPSLPGPVDQLGRACGGGIEIVPGRVKFNPLWQCTVDLYQPSRLALEILLDNCLGSRVGALLTYAEIAHDLIFHRPADAVNYESCLLQRVVMRYQRDGVRRFLNTHYFNDRSDASKSKRGRVNVIYSDKPSKLPTKHSGQPCAHIECRITGSAKLAAVGLVSVGDLPEFNFGSFWKSAVSVYELPTKTGIGQMIGGPRGNHVSGTALRKRGHIFLDECSIDGQFYMHNAVRREPNLLRKLVKMPLMPIYIPAL